MRKQKLIINEFICKGASVIKLRLYMTVKNTNALGAYNRYAVWVQGCLRSCPGCISKDSQSMEGGYEKDIKELADDILNTDNIEGITISGGEPFLQSEELVKLIKMIKSQKDLGVIVYTGFSIDDIKDNELVKHCDLIIDGNYQEELNDGLSLRGSSNQNVCLITNRYIEESKTHYGIKGRKIELHLFYDRTTMVGIPDKNSLQLLDGG